jgi:hypothetical protein
VYRFAGTWLRIAGASLRLLPQRSDALGQPLYVKRAMCQAAWAASHTKGTYLSAFYRRMSIRKGGPKAVMALAHHMLVVVHQVLSRREEYVEFGGDYYDQRNKPRTVARLVRRLQKLGYQVDLQAVADAAADDSRAVAPEPESRNGEVSASDPRAVPPKRGPGRPCKCSERRIVCKHRTATKVNLLIPESPPPA